MLPGTYKKREFTFGRQDIAPIGGIKSVFYVMPSSSARCAAFPTSDTKLPWFREIKALKGIVINQKWTDRSWKIFNSVLGNQKLSYFILDFPT